MLLALVFTQQFTFDTTPPRQLFKPALIIHSASKRMNILQTDNLNLFQFEEENGMIHTLEGPPELTPINFTIFDDRVIPDYKDQGTIIGMAKMSWKAYYEPKNESELGFGWSEPGLRGYIFVPSWITTNDEYDKVEDVVISIKGTSFSLTGGDEPDIDKKNDNLLFSCCCAVIDRTWKPICECADTLKQCNETCIHQQVMGCAYPGCHCPMGECQRTYFDSAREILEIVKSKFPNARIHTTGHSLGGAMATIILHMVYGDPSTNSRAGGTLTFEAPAQRMALHRLGLLFPAPVFNFGNSADPVFTGECNGITSSCYYFG